MKFKYTILYVDNVPETLRFFSEAFGFKTRFLHPTNDYGELDTGETTISFSAIKLMNELGKTPSAPDPKKPVFEIAFETDNVPGALEKALKGGAELIQEAKEEAWGQTTAYVADRNGFLIEICSPVAPQQADE